MTPLSWSKALKLMRNKLAHEPGWWIDTEEEVIEMYDLTEILGNVLKACFLRSADLPPTWVAQGVHLSR